MRANKLAPSPHIEAADLDGKDCVCTFKDVGFSLVGQEKVNKGVVYFEEFDRGFVLNRTNLKRIVALHGMDTDKWKGKKVTLYPTETEFQGKTVPCIRVKEKATA